MKLITTVKPWISAAKSVLGSYLVVFDKFNEIINEDVEDSICDFVTGASKKVVETNSYFLAIFPLLAGIYTAVTMVVVLANQHHGLVLGGLTVVTTEFPFIFTLVFSVDACTQIALQRRRQARPASW